MSTCRQLTAGSSGVCSYGLQSRPLTPLLRMRLGSRLQMSLLSAPTPQLSPHIMRSCRAAAGDGRGRFLRGRVAAHQQRPLRARRQRHIGRRRASFVSCSTSDHCNTSLRVQMLDLTAKPRRAASVASESMCRTAVLDTLCDAFTGTWLRLHQHMHSWPAAHPSVLSSTSELGASPVRRGPGLLPHRH